MPRSLHDPARLGRAVLATATWAWTGSVPAGGAVDVGESGALVGILGAALLGATATAVAAIRTNRRLRAALAAGRAAQRTLAERERRQRSLVEQAGDVIWTMDLDGALTSVSPAVERLLGFRPDEAVAQGLHERLTPASARIATRALASAVEAVRTGQRLPTARLELEERRKDGSTVWTEVSASGLYDEHDRFVAILGLTRDVTERRKAEEQMAHRALHDDLTGLPNRALVQDRVEQAIVSAARGGERFALVMVDLDGFKPVNDTFGHIAGDQVLRDVARRLEGCVRSSDTVGRVGGDEFVLVLHHVTGAADVDAVTAKVHEALARPFVVDTHPVRLGGSSGSALYPDDGTDERSLTNHADAAMYRAKRAKRA